MTTETKVDNRYTTKGQNRALFQNVHEARIIGKKGKDKKFSVTLGLVDGDDLNGMKAKAIVVAKARWPGRAIQNPNNPQDPALIQLPFVAVKFAKQKATNEKKDPAIYDGFSYILSARSGEEYPPRLVIRDENGEMRELNGTQVTLEGKQKFYNGAFVGVSLSFSAYSSLQEGGIGAYSGVKAFLSSVIWLADGPRIGGNATETFRHYAGEVTNENPLGEDGAPAGGW